MYVYYIKEVLDSAIEIAQNLIEDEGMSGNYASVDVLQTELNTLTNMRSSMEDLSNSAIEPAFMLGAIKKALPDFDVDLYKQYVTYIINRKKAQITSLTTEVADLEVILNYYNIVR